MSSKSLIRWCVASIDLSISLSRKLNFFSISTVWEFIDSFNGRQLEGVLEFFDTMPKVRHLVEVTNPVTGVKGEVLLEGIESFLE